MDAKAWSIYGAERSQPVATGGKWDCPENGSNKPKPLPWVAISCRAPQNGKEGVDGSSPSEGFRKSLQKGYVWRIWLPVQAASARQGNM